MSLASLSLIDPDERRAQRSVDLAPSDYPLRLELSEGPADSYWWRVIAGSIAVHLLLLTLATRLPTFEALRTPERRVVEHRIPLYLPRDVLTQKAPNKREVTKQVDLEALLELKNQQAQKASPAPSVKQFETPKIAAGKQAGKTAVTILPDAPAVNVSQASAQPLPGAINGLSPAPPPATTSSGPFQNIGAETPPNPHPTLTPPKATVDAAINGLRQSGIGSHVALSDDSATPGSLATPGTIGQAGAQHAGVELKSDPQGVDMRPYLAQILTIVRGNWRRVIPAGVHAGTLRGRTVMEFTINRDGSIGKMVTAESSGLDPLDRAALTGMVMSNPLPALPPEFRGQQVRLSFTFNYNMATP